MSEPIEFPSISLKQGDVPPKHFATLSIDLSLVFRIQIEIFVDWKYLIVEQSP